MYDRKAKLFCSASLVAIIYKVLTGKVVYADVYMHAPEALGIFYHLIKLEKATSVYLEEGAIISKSIFNNYVKTRVLKKRSHVHPFRKQLVFFYKTG